MAIPKTREDLIRDLETSFEKLDVELDRLTARDLERPCVDDWSVKDLLAVRAWWNEQVVIWIRAWRRGERPAVPAPGYRWNQTPQLNASIAASCHDDLGRLLTRLRAAHGAVRGLIDDLSDAELLQPGTFDEAGQLPLVRWLSINTTRQFTTARTYLRRTLKRC